MNQSAQPTEATNERPDSEPASGSSDGSVAVEIHVKLGWSNQVGFLFGERGWGAIVFKRKVRMPILPCPFDYFPNGPEWINDVTVTRWNIWQSKDDTTEIWADAEMLEMGEGTKESVEETIAEMLAVGWERVH